MAYDEELANRLRECLGAEAGVTERRMFGGLAFMINGNLALSVSGQGGLLLRVDSSQTESLVKKEHARRFEMRGREMDGWLRVDADGVKTMRDLKKWVAIGVAHARSLPPK